MSVAVHAWDLLKEVTIIFITSAIVWTQVNSRVNYDRMWSTGEGNGKPLQFSCFENPMNSMKRQKDRTLKDELSGR